MCPKGVKLLKSYQLDNKPKMFPSISGKDVIPNGTAGSSAVSDVAGAIDEDLFDDEDLDELEEDLENLEV